MKSLFAASGHVVLTDFHVVQLCTGGGEGKTSMSPWSQLITAHLLIPIKTSQGNCRQRNNGLKHQMTL